MSGPVRSILNRVLKDKDEPLNVLLTLSDSFYETKMAETGHNFYLYTHFNENPWNQQCRPPASIFPLPNINDLPSYLDIDVIVCQSRLHQYDNLANVANFWHLPIVLVEHSMKDDLNIKPEFEKALQNRYADIYVFDSNEIRESWGGVGYVLTENNFVPAWDNILKQASKITFMR